MMTDRVRHAGVGGVLRAAVLAAALAAGGCETEERIIRYRPMLSNIPDAQMGIQPVVPEGEFDSPISAEVESLVVERPDGSVVLMSKSIRHVLIHLERLLSEDGIDLFYDQLVSDQTKEYLRGEGHDPREFADFLLRNRDDVMALLRLLPFGEHTPTAVVETTGRNEFVLRMTGSARRNLRFTRMWFAIEDGRYRLMWIS